jgi:hypothetical protein
VPVTIAHPTNADPVVQTDLRLAPLAAGEYAMELIARFGNDEQRRVTAFRVVQ